jgi:prepilin-type N-terminal cleavage/methylation domain-containing protein
MATALRSARKGRATWADVMCVARSGSGVKIANNRSLNNLIGSPATGRRGFTLFELLVVLAIFLVVASLATPYLLRTFNAQALKGGADQVRTEFDRARVQAIRTGNVFAFLYQPAGDTYTLSPLVNAYSLVNPSIAAALNDSPTMKQLPQGLLFAGSSVSDDARAQFESESGQFNTDGMTPILFYPDGTSQDAYLFIQNKQGERIRIYLRGLTGMSSASRLADDGGGQ